MEYRHNDFTDRDIVQDTVLVESFDKGTCTKTLTVAADVSLTYIILMKEQAKVDVRLVSGGTTAYITAKALCLARSGSDLCLKMHAHLMHSHSSADIHMISLLDDEAVCEVDGGVDLHEHIVKVSGHLLEENIILGKHIQIKTLPMLDVRSNDVSASHGARIERLDEKKMFYLQSRGLATHTAKELMISGYFEQVFSPAKQDADNLDIARLEKEWLDYFLYT